MRHSPKMRHFQAHHVQVFLSIFFRVFFWNGSHSPNFKIKTYSVLRRLKMFWISLLKLGFTLKKIDLSAFSSLQRYFLYLPDFLLFSRASAPVKRTQRSPIRNRKLKPIDPKKEVQSKVDHNNVYCFFITIFGLTLPAFFSKPDNMQDCRTRFLQLISFLNQSLPEEFGYEVSVLRPSVQTLG